MTRLQIGLLGELSHIVKEAWNFRRAHLQAVGPGKRLQWLSREAPKLPLQTLQARAPQSKATSWPLMSKGRKRKVVPNSENKQQQQNRAEENIAKAPSGPFTSSPSQTFSGHLLVLALTLKLQLFTTFQEYRIDN